MKEVYRVLDPIGWESEEVGDKYLPSVPYTSVPPLKNLKFPQSQYFNWKDQVWIEVILPDVSQRVSDLEKSKELLEKQVSDLTDESKSSRNSVYDVMAYISSVEESVELIKQTENSSNEKTEE